MLCILMFNADRARDRPHPRKEECCKRCSQEWQLKWTPAIIQYSDTSKGRQGALFKQMQKVFEGGKVYS